MSTKRVCGLVFCFLLACRAWAWPIITNSVNVQIGEQTRIDFSVPQGEPRVFESRFLAGTNAVSVTNFVADYLYQTDVGLPWYTAPCTVHSGGYIRLAWNSGYDNGSPRYMGWLRLLDGTNPFYRLKFDIRMIETPGFTPNATLLTLAPIDFGTVTWTNEPWIESGATGVVLNGTFSGTFVGIDTSLVAGVSSWNGRSGPVTPQAGDYTAEMVGALSNGAPLNGTNLTDGTVESNKLSWATREWIQSLQSGLEIITNSEYVLAHPSVESMWEFTGNMRFENNALVASVDGAATATATGMPDVILGRIYRVSFTLTDYPTIASVHVFFGGHEWILTGSGTEYSYLVSAMDTNKFFVDVYISNYSPKLFTLSAMSVEMQSVYGLDYYRNAANLTNLVGAGIATNAGSASAGYYAMSNGAWTLIVPGVGTGGGADLNSTNYFRNAANLTNLVGAGIATNPSAGTGWIAWSNGVPTGFTPGGGTGGGITGADVTNINRQVVSLPHVLPYSTNITFSLLTNHYALTLSGWAQINLPATNATGAQAIILDLTTGTNTPTIGDGVSNWPSIYLRPSGVTPILFRQAYGSSFWRAVGL